MAINYNDSRFQQVEEEKNQALSETKNTYDQMVNDSQSYYQQQIDASKDWANKQSELQQAQTDFAIEKVEQTKQQAEKQYTREQKGAYTDYQKATNQFGVNAEQLAAQGLNQAGYSESTRTNAYNTYQNRYSAARESYNQAILNYDNSIKEAQLANNSALATIAYEALQQQLELSLQGFQYKNQLLLQKLDAVNQTEDRYYSRWQNVQQQINTENSMAEQIRQYNQSLAFQKEQAKQQQSNWEKEYALAKKKSSSGGSGGSGGNNKKGGDEFTDGENNNQQQQQKQQESGKLSQAGMKFYKTALTIKNARSGSAEQSARFAANYIADAYKRSGLSESDMRIIIDKLGLE
jgi:hypothetical protein